MATAAARRRPQINLRVASTIVSALLAASVIAALSRPRVSLEDRLLAASFRPEVWVTLWFKPSYFWCEFFRDDRQADPEQFRSPFQEWVRTQKSAAVRVYLDESGFGYSTTPCPSRIKIILGWLGSGEILWKGTTTDGPRAYGITNWHVLEYASFIRWVRTDPFLQFLIGKLVQFRVDYHAEFGTDEPAERKFTVRFVPTAMDKELDAAIIEFPSDLPTATTVTLDPAPACRERMVVWHVGAPHGISKQITEGRVASCVIRRFDRVWHSLLMTYVPAAPGSSGGMIVDPDTGLMIALHRGAVVGRFGTDTGLNIPSSLVAQWIALNGLLPTGNTPPARPGELAQPSYER